MEHFKLDNKEPVRCEHEEWVEWITMEKCLVRVTSKRGITVSTIFLGVSNGPGDDGRHYLFETLVRGGKHDLYNERYATWKEAEEGHGQAVKMVYGWFTSMLLTIKEMLASFKKF